MNPDCRKPVLLWSVFGGLLIGAVDFLRTSNLRRGVHVGFVSIISIATLSNVICYHMKFKSNQRGHMPYFDFKERLDKELNQKHSSCQ
ncbi:hypothetical protein EWB00_002436 [Schistosoma japonicum]|uniref:Cytochrome c oxidase assembly protein COX20, mitochondrial n=1 Tax=Schistosoma japonicum TaxID=6182 RepID=A0A4Z2DCI9_SCHJA|nr:hypothetical protein EWB00_002436 [Schistosoma japonicum]